MKCFFKRLWDYINIPSDILYDSKYLAQSTDTADLERRMRHIERARNRMQHL